MSEAEVQTLLEIMQSRPEASDNDLSRALQNAGFSVAIAERTLAFVPMACARVILRSAQFSGVYLIPDDASGAYERHRLGDDSIFVAALEVAERLGGASPLVIHAAARSAEMRAAKQLLGPGSTPQDLVFIEPVLMRIPPTRRPPPAKPWWRFW
jgi:hypothetical protein